MVPGVVHPLTYLVAYTFVSSKTQLGLPIKPLITKFDSVENCYLSLFVLLQMRMYGFKKVKPTDSMERVIEKEDSNSSTSADYAESRYHPRFDREIVSQILNSSIFQVGIVGLVLLDALLVISELLANLNALEVHRHSTVPRVLRFICISILTLFMAEFLVKLVALRTSYLRSCMEIFDTLVIVITFSLSLAFCNSNGYHSSIGLLVLLRLWRIAKIINGMKSWQMK